MATEESKQIFCWGEIVREERCVRKIYVSRAGDPVHAGDKALTRETPVQRGRVNRYGIYCRIKNSSICVVTSYNFFF